VCEKVDFIAALKQKFSERWA